MAGTLTTESLTTDRMPFIHWLSLRHTPGDRFYDLAHLVLSGGPDNMWMQRFDLSPHMVYCDVQLLYAAARHGVTADHVEAARAIRDEYYNNAPTVADAVMTRHQSEQAITDSTGEREVSAALRGPFAAGFTPDQWSTPSDRKPQHAPPAADLVPQVTDADGNDTEYDDSTLPMVRVHRRCSHFDADRRTGCNAEVAPGNTVCTKHGGKLYTDAELKNIHRTTKEKLLAASEAAVDNLVGLLGSTNDMVRLKASEAILDRTGFVPGVEVQVTQAGPDRSPAQIILERLERLESEPPEVEQVSSTDEGDVVDAALVDDEQSGGSEFDGGTPR